MMGIILTAVFLAVTFLSAKPEEKTAKRLYIVFGAIAVILGAFAGILAENDHVGSSLSGMISIFMR